MIFRHKRFGNLADIIQITETNLEWVDAWLKSHNPCGRFIRKIDGSLNMLPAARHNFYVEPGVYVAYFLDNKNYHIYRTIKHLKKEWRIYCLF
jgi:hypothetical protein